MITTAHLPKSARLPINRCNLPAVILGSITFQRHASCLYIDGVHELHAKLFKQLDKEDDVATRVVIFRDYMTVHFRLHQLEDAGLDTNSSQDRPNADYLHTIRGWFFNPEGREAAALKAWVESRFGLLARYHKGALGDTNSEHYLHYLDESAKALYCTNALESQLDLLFSYCQYELAGNYEPRNVLTLFRGINRLEEHDILQRHSKNSITLLLNNLNSFTSDRERADEFGDYCLQVDIPWQKLVFYSDLFPGLLSGENEYLVLGGVYQANFSYY